MSDEAMAAVLASRDDEVQVLGVFDAANKKEAALELRRLGGSSLFGQRVGIGLRRSFCDNLSWSCGSAKLEGETM
ncbi:hypothetical protein FJ950_13210 [Mesorhizobium sp. B2-3-14]|uniref:hypothetical protein n=1 Tax=Mesorhizobium sp. B2-3-14 TaxID=2589950 RepID=UPI00112EE36D|nr:hypothetical protein [Mesorhizobium sp. B2-3-14]TPL85698.1 hypothetical protein FJ950_13210 [Mesorhizobium sp. B2-3-14]